LLLQVVEQVAIFMAMAVVLVDYNNLQVNY
jgi:hypothetical protein